MATPRRQSAFAARRQSVGLALKQFAQNFLPNTDKESFEEKMPTTQINIVFTEPRVLAGELLQAKILIDSADPDTIIHSLTAEVTGVGRTGWVNVHTDKIFETEKILMNTSLSLCPEGMRLPVGKHQFPLQVGSISKTREINLMYLLVVSNRNSADFTFTLTYVFPIYCLNKIRCGLFLIFFSFFLCLFLSNELNRTPK